ncbi:MAG: glycosyltransferase family 4 protein [Chloroflexi bacterium]|nr:glycosyltransferase family 4 protein [Chloroflexota bacterium]
MRIVMVGPFGMRPRMTMRLRAMPMAKVLVGRGHTVTLLLPPWQNPEDAGARWEEAGVHVENIALPLGVPGLQHLWTTHRLVRRALELKPDVIHCFKPKAYAGLVHWWLRQLVGARRPRLVVDTDDWEGPGGWNEIGGYGRLQRGFFTWQEQWGLTHADAVTVASRALQSLAWALGVKPQTVAYIPNGVPDELERPVDRTGSGIDTSIILLYTRFFEFSVHRVVEVLRQVRVQIPQARLLVVGQGFHGEEQVLLRLAGELDLEEAVEYTGWIPEDLPNHFARAALAIYPFDDTLLNRTKCPVKLLELIGAGVPVVADAVGEIREIVRHDETGLLVEPGDVNGFAEAVVRIMRDDSLRRRLGRAAVLDATRRLTWRRCIKQLEQAYGDTL